MTLFSTFSLGHRQQTVPQVDCRGQPNNWCVCALPMHKWNFDRPRLPLLTLSLPQRPSSFKLPCLAKETALNMTPRSAHFAICDGSQQRTPGIGLESWTPVIQPETGAHTNQTSRLSSKTLPKIRPHRSVGAGRVSGALARSGFSRKKHHYHISLLGRGLYFSCGEERFGRQKDNVLEMCFWMILVYASPTLPGGVVF